MASTWAALFDWDGVVIDSSAAHQKSWEQLARQDGLLLDPAYFAQSFGMKNERIIPEILKWSTDPVEIAHIADRKEAIYRDILRADGIEALPGVAIFLKRLAEAGVPCVVASSTCRLNIEAAIDLIGLRSYFLDIVSGDDVIEGKPAPDIFLKAAEKAGHDPSHCVVFEDALVGVEAARRGGMRCVAVTTTHPAVDFPAIDWVVDRLDELELAELTSWFDLPRASEEG